MKLPGWPRRVKGMMAVELSAGQMVEDVKLAVNGQSPGISLWDGGWKDPFTG